MLRMDLNDFHNRPRLTLHLANHFVSLYSNIFVFLMCISFTTCPVDVLQVCYCSLKACSILLQETGELSQLTAWVTSYQLGSRLVRKRLCILE